MKSLKRTSKIQTKIKTVLTQMLSVGVVAIIGLFLIEAPASGFSGSVSGAQADPYKITNVTQLQEMADDLDAHYVLMNDIDCSDTVNWNSGAGFAPVGNSSTMFTGTFDGQNHTITGLHINRPSTGDIGLFGLPDSSATISNVALVDVDINGYNQVGALVGRNDGDVINCYATGSVSGTSHTVGGLVGCLNGGTISNSYATASVTSSGSGWEGSQIGGLVGYVTTGTISNCYSTGSVTQTGSYPWARRVGGFVGLNYAVITNCYYNNHAGNPSVGIGIDSGPGDCTAIDDNESYFYYSSNPPMSSWDFVNIWGIDEGVSYPYLLWQPPIVDTTPPTIHSISVPARTYYGRPTTRC